MAWQDRVRAVAAYVAPSGSRHEFDFEGVGRETTKRTAGFDFPGVDEAYVQDNGHGARRFPLRCIFTGDDCDLDADAFEEALLERGIGRLEHPLYGTFDVIPFESITRRDDLVEGANQAIVEVTFWTSVSAVYPEIQTARASEVEAELDEFAAAAALELEDNADLSTATARAAATTRTANLLTQVRSALGTAAAATDAIEREMDIAERELRDGLSTFVGEPAALAARLVALTLIPARAEASILDRLDAYGGLLASVVTSAASLPASAFVDGVVLPGRRRSVANDFHIGSVLANAAVAGAVASVVETTFATRPEALAAAEVVLALLDTVVPWLDAGHEALAAVDAPGGVTSGAAIGALRSAVSVAAGYLVEISFTLRPERRLVLDRPRTVLDLAAELYGDVGPSVDYLIETNDLSGSEILELPRGRTIVFYA